MSDDEDEVQVFRGQDGTPVVVPAEVAYVSERPYRAYCMKQSGMSWEEVAQAEQYPTARAAAGDVRRYLDEGVSLIDTFTRKQLTEIEYSRLDALLHAVWGPATAGHPPSVNTAAGLIALQIKLLRLTEDIRDPAADVRGRAVVVGSGQDEYVGDLKRAAGEG